MDQNFPTIRLGISIPEGASGPAKVEIAYSRQERDRIPDREWVCRDVRTEPSTFFSARNTTTKNIRKRKLHAPLAIHPYTC